MAWEKHSNRADGTHERWETVDRQGSRRFQAWHMMMVMVIDSLIPWLVGWLFRWLICWFHSFVGWLIESLPHWLAGWMDGSCRFIILESRQDERLCPLYSQDRRITVMFYSNFSCSPCIFSCALGLGNTGLALYPERALNDMGTAILPFTF